MYMCPILFYFTSQGLDLDVWIVVTELFVSKPRHAHYSFLSFVEYVRPISLYLLAYKNQREKGKGSG